MLSVLTWWSLLLLAVKDQKFCQVNRKMAKGTFTDYSSVFVTFLPTQHLHTAYRTLFRSLLSPGQAEFQPQSVTSMPQILLLDISTPTPSFIKDPHMGKLCMRDTVKLKIRYLLQGHHIQPITTSWSAVDLFQEMEAEKNSNKPLILSGLIMSMGLFSLLLGSRLVPQMILLWILGFLITNKRYLWVEIIFKTFHRDVLAAVRFFQIRYKIWQLERNMETVPKVFQKICEKHPQKVAFHYENEAWTFQQVDEFSNQVGHYFKSQGFKKGDTIALYMENRVEFISIWLGLSKIGVVTALINANLCDKLLIHSLKAAKSLGVIFSSELSESVLMELQDQKLYCFQANKEKSETCQANENFINLNKCLSQSSKHSLTKEMQEGNSLDKLLYIYTSGTTGLPKAAVINNNRYFFMAYGVRILLGVRDDDVLYDSLPLYHTSGGIVAAGQALLGGTTVVIRKKFSASNFWPDCIKYECTVACYIGEICRYLLSVPEKPHDKQHKIRLMFGNGLRPQIWTKFVNRFQVKQIGEFYGSTEGNSNLVNIDNKVGTVGFVPRLAGGLYPVALIKINQETEEPIRNSNGFCIRCQPGEPGMFIGKINPKKALNSFTGYADKEASEKKILKNVFTEGDQYFNSGDILVMDNYGYFSFKDRTGDTFRWRGENVATSEVEAVISNIIGLKDAIVYGVEVPHVEGRAGMVAILDTENALNLKELEEGLKQMLPSYERPLFIRIINDLPLTGTYKLKKKELQLESYNIKKIKDRVYFYDLRTKKFELLTPSLYEEIQNGSVNL